MILTTKGRYAVMAIIDLHESQSQETDQENDEKKPVSLLSIAQRQDISLSYLEQIFANLRKKNIVKSIKGPGGGYVIAKKSHEISLFDIISATGENIKVTNCKKSQGGCEIAKKHNAKTCKTHHLWYGLEENIINYLNSISILDICNKKL